MTNTPNYHEVEDDIMDSINDDESYIEAEDEIVGNTQGQVGDVLSGKEEKDEVEDASE